MVLGHKAAFHTLGCKLNFSETSTLARQLAEAGYARVHIDDAPDVVVINTCSVTDHADAKCRNAVRRAMQSNPEAFVVVVGCYAQLKPAEIADIDGVDLVLGAGEKFNLADHLASASKGDEAKAIAGEIKEVRDFIPGFSSGDRTRTFLKVQDGCNYFCAFCTIPLARGRSRKRQRGRHPGRGAQGRRSRSEGNRPDRREHRRLRHSTRRKPCWIWPRRWTNLDGVERFRISSIEPNLLEDDLIDFVATSQKFQPHFHIPLQSGSDDVLAAMRRRYRTELYASRIRRIREKMPHASIGVDVIVGFPGETDALFMETVDFIKSLDVSYLHVFTYSERPNTTALRIDDVVPVPVRKERNKTLRNVSLKAQRAHYESHLHGHELPVLFEEAEEDGLRMGYTPNYIRVAVPSTEVQGNAIRP